MPVQHVSTILANAACPHAQQLTFYHFYTAVVILDSDW